MTSSADIETQWSNLVWANSDILAITTKIHTYPVTEQSEKEITAAYSGNQINFIEAITTRTQRHLASATSLGRIIQYDFTVTVNYYRETDTEGSNFTEVRDAFETIFSTVLTGLGNRWNGTVDYWRPQEGPPEITQTRLDGALVWRGAYSYFATKAESL